MSDAISHNKHNQRLWNKAREYTCMYYGMIPMKNHTKEEIEEWLEDYGRTPEQMKSELQKHGMLWWIDMSKEALEYYASTQFKELTI